jgi:hypothetical protein
VPTCLFFGCVWKEINNGSFEDLERSLEDILTSFFHTLYLWTMSFVSPLSLNFGDFLVFRFLVMLFLVYFCCT